MKKLVFLILLFCSAINVNAQYPKLIVQFTNKGGGSGFQFANPSAYLSAKAITRRTNYNISIDSSDIPVSTQYINTVLSQGPVTLLSTSKWLNQILIQCTDANAINNIMALPFVKGTQGVGYRPSNTNNKINEVNADLPLNHYQQRNTADNYFNYGNSAAQIELHEGEFLHNKGYRGENITIAVLDAGFYQYSTNRAFDSVRNAGQILGVRDFVDFDNSVTEDNTHGMHCASIMASNIPGEIVGSSPKANYWFIRTENINGEYPIEEHNWVVGSEFADSSGADMISSSLGYFTFDDPAFNHTYSEFYTNKAMVSYGATMGAKKGMIVMNSAGNEAQSTWKYLGFPADADSVCAIAAVDVNKNTGAFTSYGYPGKTKPNVASVGVATTIISTGGSAIIGYGTSYANPNMAGLVACLWQAFPQFNNMKILDALYKSADKYNNPDDRQGFGVPNMRIAYQLLKKDDNTIKYGNEWLWVSPLVFNDTIAVKFIGRIDGNAKLELLNNMGIVEATANFVTEKEELYQHLFNNLSMVAAGNYIVKYSDANTQRSIAVKKEGTINNEWLKAGENNVLNLFTNQLTVYITAPETAKAAIRLIDASGKTVSNLEQNFVTGDGYNLQFNNSAGLTKGVYFVEYKSENISKVIKVVKQ